MMHPALSFILAILWRCLEAFADLVVWCFHQAYELAALAVDVRRRRRAAQLRRFWLPRQRRPETDQTIVQRMLRMHGLERDE